MALGDIVVNLHAGASVGGNANDFGTTSAGTVSSDLTNYDDGTLTGVSLSTDTAFTQLSSGRNASSPTTTLSSTINDDGAYFALSSGVSGTLTFTVPATVDEVDVRVYNCTTVSGQTALDVTINGSLTTVDSTGNTTGTFITAAGVVPNGSNQIVIEFEDTDSNNGYYALVNGIILENFVESSGVTGDIASTLSGITAAGTGTVETPVVTGDIASTLAGITAAGTGTVETTTPTFTNDTFDGTGTLGGHWSVLDESAGGVINVGRVSDYFEGTVDDNSSNRTRWFDGEEGRFDYQTIAVPSSGTDVYIFRGVGVGPSTGDRLDDLSYTTNQFSFCGPMVKQGDDSMFAVAGHRGSSDQFTVEIKGTVSGTSTVTDEGADALGSGKTHGDFRVEIASTGTAKFSYSPLDAETWTYINTGNTGLVPAAFNLGSAGTEFQLGIIGYASDTIGVPFKFMVNSVELQAPITGDIATTLAPMTAAGTGTVAVPPVTGNIASTLSGITAVGAGTVELAPVSNDSVGKIALVRDIVRDTSIDTSENIT